MKPRPLFLSMMAAALLALGGHAALSQSPSSIKLSDTLGCETCGDINLLRDVSATQLEAFRSTNGGQLVFAVDVDEQLRNGAFKGLEKATSQGFALESVSIEAIFPGSANPRVYSSFSTETRALVTSADTGVRARYYTLLGDAGTDRDSLTSGKIGNKYFDSTLKVTVPDNLSTATSVVMKVRLLDVNNTAGEPEIYYEYATCCENLALLTPSEAAHLDQELPLKTSFRAEAPAMELSPEGLATQQAMLAKAGTEQERTAILAASTSLSWVSQPSSGAYQVLAYEDMMPHRGDYDFNDAVIGYRYNLGLNAAGLVVRINGEAVLLARGSNYTHDWTLDLPIPAGTSATVKQCSTTKPDRAAAKCKLNVQGGLLSWTAFQDTRNVLPVTSATKPQRNTIPGEPVLRGARATFSVAFSSPVPLTSIGLPDPHLYVVDSQKTVRNTSKDQAGYPFVLTVPSGWRVPIENADLGLAYPSLLTYLQTGGVGARDWYLSPANGRIVDWRVIP